MSRCRNCHFAALAAVALGVGSVLAALAFAEPPAQRKYALLVGVNEYDRRGFDALEYAERDVEELAKVLRAGGYEVVLLTGPKATKAGIEQALEGVLAQTKKSDLLLIALAGHGQQVEVKGPGGVKDEPFFCPRDAVRGDPATMLGLTALLTRLDERGAGTNLILVDACRNDPDPTRGRGIDGQRIKELPEGTAILFSCSRGQRAFESGKAGGGHGVFFHFVLEGLEGKAAREGGQVTWDRLVTYVKEGMGERLEEFVPGKTQTPHAVTNLARTPVLLSGGSGPATPVRLPAELKVDLGGGVSMEFVLIQPGTFTMGSPEGETGHYTDEVQHEVEITKPYYLGKYTATKEQFGRFVAASGYETEPETDGQGGWGYDEATGKFEGRKPKYTWKNTGWEQTGRHPVVNVTWNDAGAFCDWLSKKEGERFRLPTEAEWEYACRARTQTAYFTGDDAESLKGYANVADASLKRKYPDYPFPTVKFDDGYAFTAPVGSFKANPWKLSDMHGNVWQWCQDWYGEYDRGVKRDPKGSEKGTRRVLRGGSWNDRPVSCRSACRRHGDPALRLNFIGFRVALSPRTP